jgi:hypothetical protein
MRKTNRWLVALGAIAIAALAAAGPGRYLERDAFLTSAFGRVPQPAVLWLSAEARAPLERALGHAYPTLRVQYWRDGERTAWILDEIGKEEPITIGIVVESGAVAVVRVLEFRESRGFEVRYPFFTDQFSGARLRSGAVLDKSVDAITGATLSVRAVDRAVRLALLLHEQALQPGS